jgi:hypothetical protein
MDNEIQFTKLNPEDIGDFFTFDTEYNCYVKIEGQMIEGNSNKFLEFIIHLDMFTFAYTGHSIKSLKDIHIYWDVIDCGEKLYNDYEDQKEPWTWCACGQHIAKPCYICLKTNTKIILRVGSSCVLKCEKIFKQENSEEENSEDIISENDDGLHRPLTEKIRNIMNQRAKRMRYLEAKRKGLLCKICEGLLNMTYNCCKKERICPTCFFVKNDIITIIMGNVNKEILKKENEIFERQKFCKDFTRRCIYNVLGIHERECMELENSFKREENKDTNFESYIIPSIDTKLTLSQIYISKGGLEHLLSLFKNIQFIQKYPNTLQSIKVFLKSKISTDKTNRKIIAETLHIKLKIKIEFYLMPTGRYKDKTLFYIFDPDNLDNLDYLLKLFQNEAVDTEIKDIILSFLKHMYKNDKYIEYISNGFIKFNLPFEILL